MFNRWAPVVAAVVNAVAVVTETLGWADIAGAVRKLDTQGVLISLGLIWSVTTSAWGIGRKIAARVSAQTNDY